MQKGVTGMKRRVGILLRVGFTGEYGKPSMKWNLLEAFKNTSLRVIIPRYNPEN